MPSVLIIDSDSEVAEVLSTALADRGVSTQVIADGADGLKAAKADTPDAIVLCVELNRVSGYSICNKLKKNADLSKIPLVLTSDKATEETFEQHKKLKTRAEQYLKKPYELDQMLGLIAQYVDLEVGEEVDDEDELVVDMDDMEVDDDVHDVDGDAFDESNSSAEGFGEGGATKVMSLPDSMKEELVAANRRDATARAIPDDDDDDDDIEIDDDEDEEAYVEAPTRELPRGRAAASGKAMDRARTEIKNLRSKVAGLEQTLQEKEQEFTERLLQESTRSREGIELKKRLGQIEREITKHKTAAERAEQRANEAEVQLDGLTSELSGAGGEKEALSEKVSQLVDKVKSLAAERDALREQIEDLADKQGRAEEEMAQAQQVRAKAKKAVDIAMQLLQDTGLVV